MVQTRETTRTPSGIAAYLGRLSALWQQGDFRWYWLASSIQGLGQSTQFMVIGWLALEITGSSAQLGLVIFLYGAPNVSFLLVAGVVADRFDRRHIMMLTQTVVGGIIVALAFLTIADLVSTWHIYVAAVFMGVFQSLSMPARMTIIGDLVDQPSVLDAVAMQNMAVHAGRMIGPPVAGIIIEVWGVGESLAFIAGCYVLSVLLVGKIGPTSRSVAPATQSVFRNFAEGVVYIKNNPMVLTVIIITCAFGGFAMSHMQVVPAMAKDVLGAGAAEIGLLFLGSAIGSLVGSMILPAISRAHVYRALLLSLVVFTVELILFAWSNWFWVTFVFFSGIGVAVGHDLSPDRGDRRGAGPGDGDAAVHAGISFLGRLPAGLSRRAVGLGGGHHGSGRAQPGDDYLVRVRAPGSAQIGPSRSCGRLAVGLNSIGHSFLEGSGRLGSPNRPTLILVTDFVVFRCNRGG